MHEDGDENLFDVLEKFTISGEPASKAVVSSFLSQDFL